jgi:hypothetical protein
MPRSSFSNSAVEVPAVSDASCGMESCIREVLEVLNEGMATLETMNAARHCLEKSLERAELAPGDHARLEAVLGQLRTEDVEITRTSVVRHIADAQAALRGELARLEPAPPLQAAAD